MRGSTPSGRPACTSGGTYAVAVQQDMGRMGDLSPVATARGTSTPTELQGARRTIAQAPAASRSYRRRSCSRWSRPCQNSHESGTRRNPPHAAGRGTSSPGCAASELRERALELLAAREELALVRGRRREARLAGAGVPDRIGLLVGQAFAPDPPRGSGRWSPTQWKVTAARGLSSSSAPLRLPEFVPNASPRPSADFSSTIRTDGAPSLVAVASAIASGCRSLPPASANHARNCSRGSAAASRSWSPSMALRSLPTRGDGSCGNGSRWSRPPGAATFGNGERGGTAWICRRSAGSA